MFPKETMQIRKEKGKELLANKSTVRVCTSSIEVLFARNGKHQHNQLSDFLS